MCKQMVLVFKLNKVDYYILYKNLNKYIRGLKKIEYKKKHNNTTKIEVYANEKRTEVFEINIHWYENINKYDISIYELREAKEIKITKVSGEYFYTKINKSIEEAIDFYNDSNFLNNDLLEQVKEIGINKSDNLLPGEKERKIIYNFMYDDKAKCYLY